MHFHHHAWAFVVLVLLTPACQLRCLFWMVARKDLGIRIANTSLYAERVALIETEQDVLLSAVTAFMNMRRSLEFVALERKRLNC